MKARFSLVGKIVDEMKFDPCRRCADFTVQVLDGLDRFHVISVGEDDYHTLCAIGDNGNLLGIAGYLIILNSHIALKPESIYILDNPSEVQKFDFISGKWTTAHLLAGKQKSLAMRKGYVI